MPQPSHQAQVSSKIFNKFLEKAIKSPVGKVDFIKDDL